jgi:hypothetical protein
MTREKIGEVYTDENGKAQILLNISDITEDFTIEAEYDEFSDSKSFENITYEINIEANDTEIESGDTLTISGEILGNNTLAEIETTVDIFINGNRARVANVIDGEFSEDFHYYADGEYEIYVGWKNARVMSEEIKVYIGTSKLNLTSEKQIVNYNDNIILTGNLKIGNTPLPNTEIKIYDGSTLLTTKTTDSNGNFSHTVSNITQGIHLFKATCADPESESKNFEVVAQNNEEIIITTLGNNINFGGAGGYHWLNTQSENATIYWGDGSTNTVSDPTTNLSHTYSDGNDKHIIVITGDIAGIGQRFLCNQTQVIDIIIPEDNNITEIGRESFYGCTGLEEIITPESIETIIDDAFNSCTNLKTVILTGNIIEIGENCFYNCPSIIDYQLYWEGKANIVPYFNTTFSTNLLTVFTIPNSEKNNYISRNYPVEKIKEREIEITIIPNKTDFNLGETVNVQYIVREGGLLAPNKNVHIRLEAPLTDFAWVFDKVTNSNGKVVQNLQFEVPTDVDIKATCGTAFDVLNLNGHIYKSDLTQNDGNWAYGFNTDLTFSFQEAGLKLFGNGEETDFILNKKLFDEENYYPLSIEYDLIDYHGTRQYTNHLINSAKTQKLIELKNKEFGVKGTILDEYPNTDNWVNREISPNSHIRMKINTDYIILFVNDSYYLMKSYNYESLIQGYFSFAVKGGNRTTYKNLKIEYIEEYELTASSNKDSVDFGETATVSVEILRADGTAAKNKKINVNMLADEQSINSFTIISDDNGECSFPYIGTNAGSVNIILEYGDERAEVTIEDGNGKTNTKTIITEPTQDSYSTDETINVSGVLLDKNGEPLANKTIKIDTEELE